MTVPYRASLDPDQGGYVSKIRIRYLVEKELDGQWVAMARLPAEAEGMLSLCETLGGKIRVEDVTRSTTLRREFVLEQEFS